MKGVLASLPALAMLVISTAGMGWLAFYPERDNVPLLVIFPSKTSANDRIAVAVETGGKIFGQGALPNSLVLQSDSLDYIAKLYQHGAWLVLDAKGNGLCGMFKSNTKRQGLS